MKKYLPYALVLFLLLCLTQSAYAGEEGHYDPGIDLLGTCLCQDHIRVRLRYFLYSLYIKMIAMMMRNQDNVRLGHGGVVGISADRINVDDHVIKGEEQRRVPDEGYFEITR